MTDPRDDLPESERLLTGTSAASQTAVSALSETVPQGVIELRAERLVVDKVREVAGALTFSREVRHETVQVPVDLITEVLVIEHVNGAQAVLLDGQPLAPGERREVLIYREEAEVAKRVVVSEEVRIGKRTLSETRVFDATLAHEELVVHETGDVQRLQGPELQREP
ncbi:YsnF/AvaK domain-containing protein [Deinococcus navajonensis]|uniref:YsnF/AvaK domain-containing protein n=1 Tax=Deinococcus navajonensis TaxID=309884 RepID=A0ABV8XSW6_9DEIO